MPSPVETLMNEHRLIEKVLAALLGYADRPSDAPREDLARFVAFLRGFADARHHGKEEDILFKAMVDRGVPLEGGPIAVMLHEHDLGRGFVSEMAGVSEGDGPLSPDESARAARAARGFVDLLRAHIQKEDQILYPMAEQVIPADEWRRIEARFAEFEEREAGPEDRAGLHAVAEDLVARYGG
jgi:hemerythrin-like domain-containing protein